MKYGKKIAKGSLQLLLITAIGTAVGYGTRLFLARNLSTEEFGLFYAVLAFVGLFFSIKSLGYRSAIARYIPGWIVEKKFVSINSAVWFGILSQFLVGIVIFAFLFFGADFLAVEFFKNERAAIVLQVMALELLITIMFLREIFQGFQKVFHFGSVEIARNVLILLFIVPLIGLGAFGMALSYLIASVVVQIFFLYYAFRRLLGQFRPVLKFGPDERAAFRFGLIAFVSTLAGYAISYSDTILLTGLKTLVDVGLYQAALPTSQLLWIFVTPINIVLLPVFSEMWARSQKATLINGLRLSLKVMLALVVGPVLVIAAWPELVISLLFGSKFLGASGALQILVFGSVFYSLMMINTTMLSAIGRPSAFTKTYIAAALLNLILNIALIPIFGIFGAAFASLASYATAFAITTVYIKRYVGMSAPWLGIGKIIFSGIATLFIMHFVKEALFLNVYVEVAATILAFLISYTFLLKILRVFSRDDVKDLDNMDLLPPVIKRLL